MKILRNKFNLFGILLFSSKFSFITSKEKNLLRQASKSHSKKHIAIMNALMNKGKSFKIAHKEALKITK